MSEANTDTDTPTDLDTPSDVADESTRQPPRTGSGDDFASRRNLYRAALVLFGLLAVVAVIQLYASVNATIDTFVADEYRPLFRTAFNLVVLLVSGIGISWTVRELSGE